MAEQQTEDNSKQMYELKKQMKFLKSCKGSGTELISVYIPVKYPLHETSGKLKEEAGQASNIKSKSTRKNVVDALERIVHYLKQFRETPPTGMAIFAGNISENPAKVVIELFSIFPPQPLNIQMYRCDSRFYLDPLEAMSDVKDTYGLVVLDGRECTIASLRGTQIQVLKRMNSTAHAKIRKGGQCLSPDTLIHLSDGKILPISDFTAGQQIKGADLSEFKIGDWTCSDKFTTKSKKAYKIICHAPTMEIEATAWHRFFTIGENGVREKYAKDLKIGERVLVAKKITTNGKKVKINYVSNTRIKLDQNEYFKLRKKRAESGWSQNAVAKMLNVSQMAICRMERGEIQLSAKKIRELYGLYGMSLDESKFAFPGLKLPVTYTPEIAYLLGAISGDGTLDGNRIIIYESYPEIVAKYCKIAKDALGIDARVRAVNKVGKKGCFAKKEYYEIRLYSKEFADFIAQELPQLISDSDKRCIPSQIQQSGQEVHAAFLKGLYDAEGYVHGKRSEITMVSKNMMRQVQALLLRQGIRASLGKKKAKHKQQWCVSISDAFSQKIFLSNIGFSRTDKQKALEEITSGKIKMQYIEQVPVDGREVYALAKSLGLKTNDFHAASNFFRNKKNLGRVAFERNIATVIRKRAAEVGRIEEIEKILAKWLSDEIGIARIAEKIEINDEREYIDLTVPNVFNFVANGFIVHNSARRYERLIEESIELYYKRIGEAMDKYFVTGTKGVIVGGPGPAKADFYKMHPYNYQIKVLGIVDTGYTEEQGLRELLAKSGEFISQQEAFKEKEIMDRFLREITTNGLAAYGERDVREALRTKKASELIVSEGLEYKRYKYICPDGTEIAKIAKNKDDLGDIRCEDGSKPLKEEEMMLIDDLIELANSNNIQVHVMSTDTSEGSQFLHGFYGIGAFLRYR